MGLRDKIVTDKGLEDEGVWFDVLDTGVSFLCCRFHAGNKEASKAYRKELELLADSDDTDLIQKAMARVWAKHVVRDWRDVTDYDFDPGAEEIATPFTAEKCEELFSIIPEVFDAVLGETMKRENFLASLRKKQEKN